MSEFTYLSNNEQMVLSERKIVNIMKNLEDRDTYYDHNICRKYVSNSEVDKSMCRLISEVNDLELCEKISGISTGIR